jgi:hypothetical protein
MELLHRKDFSAAVLIVEKIYEHICCRTFGYVLVPPFFLSFEEKDLIGYHKVSF